jgi:hypothetical protein
LPFGLLGTAPCFTCRVRRRPCVEGH